MNVQFDLLSQVTSQATIIDCASVNSHSGITPVEAGSRCLPADHLHARIKQTVLLSHAFGNETWQHASSHVHILGGYHGCCLQPHLSAGVSSDAVLV